MPSSIVVIDDAPNRRYLGSLDGTTVGFATYVITDDVMELPHTVVPPRFEGRGYAGAIVGYALDDARSRGLRVLPTCPYVARWIDKHPEYAELRV